MTATPGGEVTVGPRVTTTDGVEIATYDLGGDGPPVLLAHATGFHGRVWLPVAGALRPRYRCVAFDTRGHGESGKAPGGDYDWRGFALDAMAVVTGLGLGQPRAVGHSAGGAALLLAEERHPGTFASLYCYEPVVPIVEDPSVPSWTSSEAPDVALLAAGARRRREVFASTDTAFDNYVAKRPFDTFDPAALHAYVTYGFDPLADGTVRLRCRAEDEARIYEMAVHHRAYQHLDLVACPVTLARGDNRGHVSADQMAAMAARLPDARIDVYPASGHFGPMEAPAEVAAAVVTAFDAMDAASLDGRHRLDGHSGSIA